MNKKGLLCRPLLKMMSSYEDLRLVSGQECRLSFLEAKVLTLHPVNTRPPVYFRGNFSLSFLWSFKVQTVTIFYREFPSSHQLFILPVSVSLSFHSQTEMLWNLFWVWWSRGETKLLKNYLSEREREKINFLSNVLREINSCVLLQSLYAAK